MCTCEEQVHTNVYTQREGTRVHMKYRHTCTCEGQPHTCTYKEQVYTCVHMKDRRTCAHAKDRHTHMYTLSQRLSCGAAALAHCRRAHLDGPVLTIHSSALSANTCPP